MREIQAIYQIGVSDDQIDVLKVKVPKYTFKLESD